MLVILLVLTTNNNSDEETRNKLLKLRNIVYEYKEITTSERHKQPVFNFGAVLDIHDIKIILAAKRRNFQIK